MVTLPDDVWQHVLDHAESVDILSWFSLNSCFLNAALQVRYSFVDFNLYSPIGNGNQHIKVNDFTQGLPAGPTLRRGSVKFYRLLDRLRDPHIKRRPRKLAICLSIGSVIPPYWHSPPPKEPPPPPSSVWNRLFDQKPQSAQFPVSKQFWVPGDEGTTDRRDRVLQDLHDVIIDLPNVIEIRWDNLWEIKDISYSRNLLFSLWSNLRSNLRSLYLSGTLECIETFLAYTCPESLETLSITFYPESPGRRGRHHFYVPTDGIFLNSIRPTLRNLTIRREGVRAVAGRLVSSVVSTIGLDDFIWDLRGLTSLRSLSLEFPLDFSMRVPAKLAGVLSIPSLGKVDLRLQLNTDHPASHTERTLVYWMESDIHGLKLDNMRDLTIHPPWLTDAVLPPCFFQNASNLTRLTILDQVYHTEKLRKLFNMQNPSSQPQLTYLSICVDHFTPELLATLASGVPYLQTLDLFVQVWFEKTWTGSESYVLKDQRSEFASSLLDYSATLSNWRLVSLGLWMHSASGNSVPVWPSSGSPTVKSKLKRMLSLRDLLFDSIPNLREVCGKPREAEWVFNGSIRRTGLEAFDQISLERHHRLLLSGGFV